MASEATLAVNAAWSEHLTRSAVEFEPDNPDAVIKLARVLRTANRNEEALGWFVKYAEMVPGDYLALAHIGSCLSALGRLTEAERYSAARSPASTTPPRTTTSACSWP